METNFTIGIPQDKPYYRKAFILTHLLTEAFKKIKKQYERIEGEMAIEGPKILPILFGDIHFFFISVANLNKILKALKDLLPEDESLKEIYKKYLPTLKSLTDMRDHLEHILDGRLDGMGAWGKKPLAQPNMLGNLINGEYDFGGEKVNLKNAMAELDNLSSELKIWNTKSHVYPLWDL